MSSVWTIKEAFFYSRNVCIICIGFGRIRSPVNWHRTYCHFSMMIAFPQRNLYFF